MKTLIKNAYRRHIETIHNFIWRTLQIAGKQGTLFIFALISAKLLSVEEFGLFTYYFTIILLLSMISDFGLSNAISKFVAEYNLKNTQKINQIILSSFLLLIVICSLIILLFFLFIKRFIESSSLIYILLPLIFLIPATSIFDGAYRGLKKFKILTKISLSSALISLIPFVYFLYNYQLRGLSIGYIFFYLTILFVSVLNYSQISSSYGEFSIKNELTKKILMYSYFLGLASVGYFLFSRFAIILMGYFGYMDIVGMYELISKFESIFLLPFFILGHIIAPKMTALYEGNKTKIFVDNLINKWLFSVIFSFIFSILFFLVTYFIIKLFFQNYFNTNFITILVILTIIFFVKAYAVIIDFGFIISSGHGYLMSYLYLFIAAFNIIFMIILNEYFGYLGIIFAILISHFIMVIRLHTKFYGIIKTMNQF